MAKTKERILQKIQSPHKVKVNLTLKQKVKKIFGGNIVKTTRRDKKGRFSDRRHLSKEKHERDYVKRVAKTWNERLDFSADTDKVEIRAGQLRRLCDYIQQS